MVKTSIIGKKKRRCKNTRELQRSAHWQAIRYEHCGVEREMYMERKFSRDDQMFFVREKPPISLNDGKKQHLESINRIEH